MQQKFSLVRWIYVCDFIFSASVYKIFANDLY